MKQNSLSANRRGFTLIELLVSITIIGILSSIGLFTFTSAQKKSRDSRRKNDLATISKSLEVYYNDHNRYPLDDNDGHLKACLAEGETTEAVCSWGLIFQHADTNPDTVYLIVLPTDPAAGQNYYFDSLSNGKKYQLYARLENTNDAAVPKDVNNNPQFYQGVLCGTHLCNYGISSSNTTPATDRTLTTTDE